MKRILVTCSSMSVFLLMLAGCAASPRVTTVDLPGIGDKGFVKLNRSVSAEGRPVNMDYRHPHDFTPSEIGSELDLLVLRKFKWGKYGLDTKWVGKPIFTGASRQKLVPALVSAFKEGTPSDRIAFSIPGRKERLTTGEVFIKENQLTWIFETIDGFPYTGKDKFWLDDEDWTIEEKTGLAVKKYKAERIIKVIRDLSIGGEEIARKEQEERAWEASEQTKSLEEDVKRTPVQKEKKVTPPGLKELEEKLQTLKRWKENGLISEEEYKKEKDRILQQLQQL